MKIAVIASDKGEKALYLHDFFKEGNRISVDCLLTDNPESPVAVQMRAEGIDVMFMPRGEVMEDLGALLRGRGVELLVIDGYEGQLPASLLEEFGDAVVAPSERGKAPLEVIEKVERLKAAAREQQEAESKDPEQEWAEVLEVDVEVENPESAEEVRVDGQAAVQPPLYSETPPDYGEPSAPQQPYGPQPQYGREHLSEPMPNNYLVWSVLLTVFCCLIPGIVAIVYSASVNSKYYAGDLEGARRASRNAQIWCIVSVVAGIIWATLYIPLMLFLA